MPVSYEYKVGEKGIRGWTKKEERNLCILLVFMSNYTTVHGVEHIKLSVRLYGVEKDSFTFTSLFVTYCGRCSTSRIVLSDWEFGVFEHNFSYI